jgi:hypothetical protein
MLKEKRSGAVSKKSKPFLDIQVYEPTKKSFVIIKESETILKLYTQFKNETSGLKCITEDSIIDALISTLKNDNQFIIWKHSKNRKEEVITEIKEELSM